MQGLIPSVVFDTEIRKQLSKMGRNKACGPDDLPIEVIMVGGRLVAELKSELLYTWQRVMANGSLSQIAGRKVNSYRNSFFTLNIKCRMPIKNHYWRRLLYFH